MLCTLFLSQFDKYCIKRKVFSVDELLINIALRFSGNDHGFLIATDVAARGLDIPNVEHVVHYQVPRTSEVRFFFSEFQYFL